MALFDLVFQSGGAKRAAFVGALEVTCDRWTHPQAINRDLCRYTTEFRMSQDRMNRLIDAGRKAMTAYPAQQVRDSSSQV